MPAFQRDMIIEQGATFDITLIWYDLNGNYVDLTDAIVRMAARVMKTDVAPVFEAVSNPGEGEVPTFEIQVTPATGNIRILMEATVTAAYVFTSAYYDIEVEFLSGTVVRLLEGIVLLSLEVTK